MWWTTIGAICIVVGTWLIYTVLVKKFPQLKLIDLSTLARERHADTKSRIIRERFDRSMGAWHLSVKAAAAQMRVRAGGLYRAVYSRLKHIEGSFDEPVQLTDEEKQEKIELMLADAAEAKGQGLHQKAEITLIEVLRLDPKHVDAYRGLADVYISQRLYDQARETLEYLIRLDSSDDRTMERLASVAAMAGDFEEAESQYLKSIAAAADPVLHRIDLGEIYMTTGEFRKAQEQFKKALESQPYNPKYLDRFLEASILVSDVKGAEHAFEVLETANPENQKLAEFRERIERLHEQSAV